MKKYKLTDQNLKTHNGFQWEIGKQVETPGNSDSLCNSQWLHYYHSPLLAILLNPIHASIQNPRLFEVKATGKHLNDNGLKGGCTKLTLIKEINIPEITVNQKIVFGILCALKIYKGESFVLWANNWLNGSNRTEAAAWAAAEAAAWAAARAAAEAAAWAAARAAAWAAARAAAWAAARATAEINLNLVKIAKQALKYK